MQKTGTCNHDESSIPKAMGIKKSEEALLEELRIICEDVTKHGKCTISEHLEKIIEMAETPEEIAFLAYKFGFGAAKYDDFAKKAKSMFVNN